MTFTPGFGPNRVSESTSIDDFGMEDGPATKV